MKLLPLSIIFLLGSGSSLTPAASTSTLSSTFGSTDCNEKNDPQQGSSFNLKQEIESAGLGLDFMSKLYYVITSMRSTSKDVVNYGMRNLRRGARFRGNLRDKRNKAVLEEFYNATGGSSWTISTGWLDDQVDHCEWHGVECNSWSVVTGLTLSDVGLTGSIPDVLNKLYFLQTLDLSNNDLAGTIPSTFGRFFKLKSLNLAENDLTGSIPSELKFLFNLETLNLSDNQLTGSLPSELAFMVNLEELYLEKNDLTGDIPDEICLLHGAWILDNITASNITGRTTRSGVCDVIFDDTRNMTGVSILNNVCSLLTSMVNIAPSLEVLSGDCGSCICCTDYGTPCCYDDDGDQQCS